MKLFKSKSEEITELQPETLEEEEKEIEPPVKSPEVEEVPPQPPRPPAPKSPPLFIKVNKYGDIIKNIRDLKSYILSLRDALDVLEDIHKEVTNGIEIAHKTLDEVNIIVSNFDSLFLRPQGIEPHMEEEEVARSGGASSGEVDNYVKDVYGQLEKLRSQLKTKG